jgi:hypothetical protein
MAPSLDAGKFLSVLRSSKNIIAIAGAGLSAASGPMIFGRLCNDLLTSDALLQVYPLSEAQGVSGDRMML